MSCSIVGRCVATIWSANCCISARAGWSLRQVVVELGIARQPADGQRAGGADDFDVVLNPLGNLAAHLDVVGQHAFPIFRQADDLLVDQLELVEQRDPSGSMQICGGKRQLVDLELIDVGLKLVAVGEQLRLGVAAGPGGSGRPAGPA